MRIKGKGIEKLGGYGVQVIRLLLFMLKRLQNSTSEQRKIFERLGDLDDKILTQWHQTSLTKVKDLISIILFA